MADTIDDAWREDNVAGDPGSGKYKPLKGPQRRVLKRMEAMAAAGVIHKATLALLTAITPPTENYGGMVYADPDPANNGIYIRTAATWVRIRSLADTFAELIDITGTANAVTAQAEPGINPADIAVWFIEPILSNTDDVVLNGLPVRNINGNELVPGEWPAGRMILLVNRVTEWRLLSDPSGDLSAALAAGYAADAAAERVLAETARGGAEAAAASITTGLPKATVVAIANLNLASPGATIDGHTMTSGATFLAAGQTAAKDNGPYVWNGAAVAATRVPSYNDFDKIAGQYFSVMEGTAYADTLWRCTTNAGGTLGTDALAFEQFASSLEQGHGLAASVAAGALTIALKRPGGADPSVANPVKIGFRSVTPGLGIVETLSISSALSLVISSGSTLGIASGAAFRIWLGIFNDGGTPRLAAKVCSDASAIYPLADWQVASATAEGGAGAADSAGVMYSSAAIASKAFRILGYLDFSTGQVTAGTWATAPDKIQLFDKGTPLPGVAIQTTKGVRLTQDSFTSTVYISTNHSATITPSSAPNRVAILATGTAIIGDAAAAGAVIIQRGGVSIGVGCKLYAPTAVTHVGVALAAMDAPGTIGAITYTVAIQSSAGLAYWPGSIGAGDGATMFLTEVMG